MRLVGSLAFFLLGAVAGAAIGALVTSIVTPQSGEEFKTHVRGRIDDGRKARATAEAEEAEAMKQRFRNKVGDPDALTRS